MKITKHAHACVEMGTADHGLLVDPGTFTPNAGELISRATAILITHEHFDHVDADAIATALSMRDDLEVWGPSAVTHRWSDDYPTRVHTVAHGDTFTADGIEVAVHGEQHALIHPDIPTVTNVGYLIEGTVFHPGDSYHLPEVPIRTLPVPTSGPWTKLSQAVDWIRAIGPATMIQIHELMLSDIGQNSMATFLSPSMLCDVPLTILAPGEHTDA